MVLMQRLRFLRVEILEPCGNTPNFTRALNGLQWVSSASPPRWKRIKTRGLALRFFDFLFSIPSAMEVDGLGVRAFPDVA